MRAAILILILAGAVFAQNIIEAGDAIDTAGAYARTGEYPVTEPQRLVYIPDPYWVIELRKGTTVNVMIPVHAETGRVDSSESAKDAIRTHYLAHKFTVDDSISNFLDDALAYAQSRGDAFSAAVSDFEIYEVQLPENISLSTLPGLKSSLSIAADSAADLRAEILSAQTLIPAVSEPAHVNQAESNLESVFSSERTFLSNAKTIASQAADFETELAGSGLVAEKPDLAQTFTGIVGTYELKASVTVTEDGLVLIEAAINSFFADLETNTLLYYGRLLERVNETYFENFKRTVQAALANYTNNYTYIYQNRNTIPPQFEDDIQQLHDLLDDASARIAEENYVAAHDLFPAIELKIDFLIPKIGTYNPYKVCDDGETKTCVADGREGTQTCVNGQWGNCVVPTTLNWTFIAILVAVFIGLVLYKFKDKFFKGGEEVEEEPYFGYRPDIE